MPQISTIRLRYQIKSLPHQHKIEEFLQLELNLKFHSIKVKI